MTNYYVNTNECCNRRVCCEWIPFIIFTVLFTFVLGLILGAVLFGLILSNLIPFIIFAVILFLLAAVALIVRICSCRRRHQQCE